MSRPSLTVELLRDEAQKFAEAESSHDEPSLYGVDNGKTIGTYLEHKFQAHLHKTYTYEEGSSASGIDLPGLDIDIKTTSARQPQSSCPFKSARQKIYGLGYSLLVFVYDKTDDDVDRTGNLDIMHTVFVDAPQTGDWQTTTGLRKIIENEGNEDDIIAFLAERMLPVDDIEARRLAEELLQNPPETGYLTISNALQWRLQYSRVISKADKVLGVYKVY